VSVGSFAPLGTQARGDGERSGEPDRQARALWRRCDSCFVLAQPRARLPVPWPRVRLGGGGLTRRDSRRTLMRFAECADEDVRTTGTNGTKWWGDLLKGVPEMLQVVAPTSAFDGTQTAPVSSMQRCITSAARRSRSAADRRRATPDGSCDRIGSVRAAVARDNADVATNTACGGALVVPVHGCLVRRPSPL
jgi:hypothetical protein